MIYQIEKYKFFPLVLLSALLFFFLCPFLALSAKAPELTDLSIEELMDILPLTFAWVGGFGGTLKFLW